eukprot:4677709-Prorocentrum_lima.AAC.1
MTSSLVGSEMCIRDRIKRRSSHGLWRSKCSHTGKVLLQTGRRRRRRMGTLDTEQWSRYLGWHS